MSAEDRSHSSGEVYALFAHGRERLEGGRPLAAVEPLELAVETEPDKASIHEALGRAYFATAQVDSARDAFESALALDPSDPYAHFGVGRCHERQGRLVQAAKHFKLACALADRDAYQRALARVQARLEAS